MLRMSKRETERVYHEANAVIGTSLGIASVLLLFLLVTHRLF